MRTFAQKQNQSQKPVSSNPARSHMATPRLHHRADTILCLQRTIGNQAVQRMLQTNAGPDVESQISGLGGGGQPLPQSLRDFFEPHLGYDFSRVHIHSDARAAESARKLHAEMLRVPVLLGNQPFQQFLEGKPQKGGGKKPEPEKPPSREPCDNKCGTSGGPYGNTECELDLGSGLLTGKVTKEVFDKNPCTRPCVEVHEGVHAKKIAPVCTAAKKCLDAARGDFKKQDKCLDKFQADMTALTFSTECAAYTAEAECLGTRAKKAECRSTDGKKRWDEQMKMVKCYKDCFCAG